MKSHNKLVGSLTKVYCHLVQFNLGTIDGPTDVETKLQFAPQLTEHNFALFRALVSFLCRKETPQLYYSVLIMQF
jgi:hypothetical protein